MPGHEVEYYSVQDDLDSATLWMLDGQGGETPIPSSEIIDLAFDEPVWQVIPGERLQPLTAYQARFHYCDQISATTFTTGPAGEPIAAPALNGTYAVKLDQADFGWDELNDEFGNLGRQILLQTQLDGDHLRLRLAWSAVASQEQDLCVATSDGEAWTLENPWFEGGARLDHYNSQPDEPEVFQGIQVGAAFGPGAQLYGVDLRFQARCHPDSPQMECIPCELPIEGSDCPVTIALTTPTEQVDAPVVSRTWDQIANDPACNAP